MENNERVSERIEHNKNVKIGFFCARMKNPRMCVWGAYEWQSNEGQFVIIYDLECSISFHNFKSSYAPLTALNSRGRKG
jgi:hypothetical protein